VIRTKRYVDVNDLPEDACSAYGVFVSECGIPNGAHESWEVGATGDDSVPESYIGAEKCALIDKALRSFGLKDGECIDLVSEW